MLTKIMDRGAISGKGKRFAVVASLYNAVYVDGLLEGVRRELEAAGVDELGVVRVPGAFEIPGVVAQILRGKGSPYHAILCLGIVIRGETTHAQMITEAVTMGLGRLQIEYPVPIIHEVLLMENEEQARVRCLGEEHHRGVEAARTALSMAEIMERITNSDA